MAFFGRQPCGALCSPRGRLVAIETAGSSRPVAWTRRGCADFVDISLSHCSAKMLGDTDGTTKSWYLPQPYLPSLVASDINPGRYYGGRGTGVRKVHNTHNTDVIRSKEHMLIIEREGSTRSVVEVNSCTQMVRAFQCLCVEGTGLRLFICSEHIY